MPKGNLAFTFAMGTSPESEHLAIDCARYCYVHVVNLHKIGSLSALHVAS